MARKGHRVLMQVISDAPQGRTRCGHAAPTIGCRACQSAQDHRRRPGRLRGKGFTKSPKKAKRRNRSRR